MKTNHKHLTNHNHLTKYDVNKLTRLASLSPRPETVKKWAALAIEAFGVQGVAVIGMPERIWRNLEQGNVRPQTARLVFTVYSVACCPSNIASGFHLATWGRFNPLMPRDYREAAQRLLDRRSGPRAAKARGEAWQLPTAPPWAKAGRLKRQYILPVGLPLLVG